MASKLGLLFRRGLSRIVGLSFAFRKPRTTETTEQLEYTEARVSASPSVSAIPKLATQTVHSTSLGIIILGLAISSIGFGQARITRDQQVVPTLNQPTPCENVRPTSSNKRLLVLLMGLGSNTDEKDIWGNKGYAKARANWYEIVYTKVDDKDIRDLYGDILYFSYNAADPETYTTDDSSKSIWGHHVPLLHEALQDCRSKGWESFDLVGHSLGGVVASEYIKLYGLAGDQKGWVKHVVPLDSPVNGSWMLRCLNFFDPSICSVSNWDVIRNIPMLKAFAGTVAAIELGGMHKTQAAYDSENKAMAEALSKEQGVIYRTLLNNDSRLILSKDAFYAAPPNLLCPYEFDKLLYDIIWAVTSSDSSVGRIPSLKGNGAFSQGFDMGASCKDSHGQDDFGHYRIVSDARLYPDFLRYLQFVLCGGRAGTSNPVCSGSPTPTPTPPTPGPTPTPTPPGPTPTLPPGVDGIELVSVSSHVVRPGEQFYPSVTIRRTSGYLDQAAHLHAMPEDDSNAFKAYPVQLVKRYVGTGGTYTFDVNNDSSFVMTAPSTPGQYQSVWQMRVGGNHIGPQAIIRITVQSDPIIPTPTPVPINCNDPPDGITLYEFTDFRGRCKNFTGDEMYLGNTYFGDDVASSLKIVGNWGVTLFQDADWGGQWQEFSSSDANLSDDPIGDNRASSLRVWRPGDPCATLPQGVTLYHGRDFTGISQTFDQDASFLGNEPIGNDSVNSLRICGNYRVTLYRDADWSGQHEEFTAPGDANLGDNPINDPNPTASSLRIIDASDPCNTLPDGVTLYTQIDFGGQKQTFSSDVMFLGNTLIGDNAARSLRVCGHWVVTLFRDADWTGPWENFTGIDANLTDNPNSNPDPTASSLRMVDSFDFCRTLPPGATLYRGRDFTGIAQTFTSDASFLGNEPIGNDTVNSLRLCGYNARLFRDPDWQGFSEEFTDREESNLSDNPINNPNATTSSIRVWLKPPPTPTPTPTPIPTPTPWATKPDLVPFQGIDWPFPLLPSSVAGSRSVYTLYAGEITYLDWGVFNNSSVNVNTSFTITVYLDSLPIIQYPFDGINANSYSGFDDWQMIVGSTGYHTLKIVVDNDDTVSEVDESNNSWEGQFYWSPNPTPVLTNKVFLPLTLRNYTPVTADFAASPTYGTTPLTVTFINTSLGSYTSSLWDFGDGITSTTTSPTHIYALTGTYTVALTVSGASETNTLQRANYITVYATSPCDDKIANGGFESGGAWEIDSGYPAAYTTTIFHNGNRSMRAGILDPAANVKGLSAFRQTVTIPRHPQSATLRFWLYPTIAGSTSDSDEQRVLLLDQLGNTVQTLVKLRSNTRAWTPYEFDLTKYAGNTLRLYFGVYNNKSGSVTAMYVDDVSLQVCPAP